MTDINVVSTNFQTEKRSWLLSPHGTDPGTTPVLKLDISTFTLATHFPNGFIPSGVVLGLITAQTVGGSLVVGPYDPAAADGRQTAFALLFGSTKVPNLADLTKDVGAAGVVHGFVRASKLPIAAGAAGGGFLDAAARTALRLIHFV